MQFSDFQDSHKNVRPSPLSDYRIFSSPQRETCPHQAATPYSPLPPALGSPQATLHLCGFAYSGHFI